MVNNAKGKYVIDEPDLVNEIRDLKRRISKLERMPATLNAGLDGVGFAVRNGATITADSPYEVDTDISHSIVSLGEEQFTSGSLGTESAPGLVFQRSNLVPGANNDLSGNLFTGNKLMVLSPIDGSSVTTSIGSKTSTLQFYDKNGDVIISDTGMARQGFDHPHLSYHAYPITFFTSTSSSFADVAVVTWYFYHPHLQFDISIQNDASNSGEIQVTANSDTSIKTVVPTASGATTTTSFSIKRSQMPLGANPNGASELLIISFRRASGAGTVRFRINGIIGLDRSNLDGDF